MRQFRVKPATYFSRLSESDPILSALREQYVKTVCECQRLALLKAMLRQLDERRFRRVESVPFIQPWLAGIIKRKEQARKNCGCTKKADH